MQHRSSGAACCLQMADACGGCPAPTSTGGPTAEGAAAGGWQPPLPTLSTSSQLGWPSWFRRVAAPRPVGPLPTTSTPTCKRAQAAGLDRSGWTGCSAYQALLPLQIYVWQAAERPQAASAHLFDASHVARGPGCKQTRTTTRDNASNRWGGWSGPWEGQNGLMGATNEGTFWCTSPRFDKHAFLAPLAR